MANSKLEEMDGAQALITTLSELGVEYVFGYSGGASTRWKQSNRISNLSSPAMSREQPTWPMDTPVPPVNLVLFL